MKDKIKILFVLHTFEHAGSQFSMLAYAKAVKQLGHDVYFVGEHGSFEKELKKEEIEYDIRPHSAFSPMSIYGIYRVIAIALREKPDLIHCNNYWPHIECLFVKAFLGIPVISTFPGGPFFNKPIIPSGHLISYSGELTEAISKKFGFETKQISTIKNRIDFSKFHSLPFRVLLKNESLCFTMVGRLDVDKKKSILSFINFIKELQKKIPVKAVFVGGGNLSNYVATISSEINKKYASEIFRLVGHTTDVLPYITKTHFIVGLGRSLMEGMSAGKPAFVPCQDGHLSLVTPSNIDKHSYYNFAGRFEFTKEEKDTNLLSCLRITQDRNYYEQLSEFVSKYINENYDVMFIQKKIENLYQKEIEAMTQISIFYRIKLFGLCVKASFIGLCDRLSNIKYLINLKYIKKDKKE